MSEDRLMQILNDVADGVMDPDDAFDEISPEIDFQEPYEGE